MAPRSGDLAEHILVTEWPSRAGNRAGAPSRSVRRVASLATMSCSGRARVTPKVQAAQRPGPSTSSNLSGRVQQWQADSEGGNSILTTDRQIIKREATDGRTLVSAVVTVLDEDDDLLTVRDATDAEAARVIAAERTWR